MELVTGRAGQAHITSAQLGSGYASIVGTDQYVARNGSRFAATVVDANNVKIADGDAWMNGRHVMIPAGSFEQVALDSGVSGVSRNDLIVIRYSKDASTETESASLVVIKGTPASSNPSDPAYNDGSIVDGLLTVDMPLWRIPISGITPGTPVALFSVLTPMDEMQTEIDGKAAASHNHAASAISSGTLGVAQGGTGKATHTSNALLLGNGGSAVKNKATANGALYATASNAEPSFGTLPVAQGGTGATTASAARTALGVAASSHSHSASAITSGTLEVVRGGTGTSSATANRVFAAPNGSNGAPSFRALAAADIPNLSASKISSGTLALAQGGTASNNTGRTPNTVFAGPSSGSSAGNATWRKVVSADVDSLDAGKVTGVLPKSHGGTGHTGSGELPASTLFTAANGYTIVNDFSRVAFWGEAAMVELCLTHTSAIAANSYVKVGSMGTSVRPKIPAYGSFVATEGITGNVTISSDGSVYVRPVVQIPASTAFRFGATFVCQ